MDYKGKNYHKCGEIFLENEKIYTFLCLYCDEFFYEFVEFKNHSITHFNSSDALDKKNNSSEFRMDPSSTNYDHTNIDSQSNVSIHSFEFKKEEIEIQDFKENVATEFAVSSPEHTESDTPANTELFCAHCKISYKINSHDFNKCSKIQDVIAENNGDFIKLLREGVLCCFYCKRHFEDYKSLYDHHLEEEHCTQTANCKICKFYIFMNSKINSKRKSNTKNITEDQSKTAIKKLNEINCEKCPVKFNSKSDYNIHFQKFHTEVKDELYNEKESVEENNGDVVDNDMSSEKGELQYKCSFCKRLFRKKAQLKTHMRIHTNDRPYKCEICSAAFTVSANLKCHIVYKHTDDRPFVCDYEGCNAKFKLMNLKKQHEKRHLPANFQCEICGNYYKTKFCLLKHQQSRHEDATNWPYQCEICTRRFARQHHLVEHTRTHTGEKPFGCDLCSKFFRKRSALREHKKLHSDKRNYVCRFCGKGFKQAAGYWGHMKRHPAVS